MAWISFSAQVLRTRRGAGERCQRRRLRSIPAERLGGPLDRRVARFAWVDQCSRALRVANCGHTDRRERRVDAGPGLRPRRDAGVARYDGPVPLRTTSYLHWLPTPLRGRPRQHRALAPSRAPPLGAPACPSAPRLHHRAGSLRTCSVSWLGKLSPPSTPPLGCGSRRLALAPFWRLGPGPRRGGCAVGPHRARHAPGALCALLALKPPADRWAGGGPQSRSGRCSASRRLGGAPVV